MIDDLDKIILKKLLADARTNFSDLAKELEISVPAVVKRFNKMKKIGLIVGTSLVLDLSENKNMFVQAIRIDLVDQSYENEVIEKIKKIKSVLNCIPVIGNYDIFVVAYTRNIDDIKVIRDRIRKISGIEKIGMSTNLDEDFLFVENLL
ncbi:MAG: Lrp/AsnC family transcriptional regulator [Candidatus Bathyarchaeota archaeon]|nr:Lrp/AsnC family transcriptional regulator [Candidatus Bathyarchaeota archaeon]